VRKINLLVVLLLLSFAYSQTSTTSSAVATSDPQAILLAQQAQLALTNGLAVSDISLNASAQWIVGGTNASGTVTLKAKGIAESRLDISAGNAARSEIRNDTSGPDGQWMGADGVRHSISPHNCWTPPAWFAPNVLVQEMLGSSVVLSYLGRETRSGVAVDHLRLNRPSTQTNPQLARDLQKLSTVDTFLDASAHLPLAVLFNTHPDNDYGRDIPIEIRFSDYRSVSGVTVPFRIQRSMQGVLNLDLTVTAATINSGLADSAFALQ